MSPLLTLMKSVKFSRTCGMLLIGISHFLTPNRGRGTRAGSHGEGGEGKSCVTSKVQRED